MSRKKSPSLESLARNAAKNAVKRTVKKAVRKETKKMIRKIPLKYLIPAGVLFLAAVIGFTFIPEDRVPRSLERPHAFLQGGRNKLLRLTRLPISGYGDVHILPNPGTDPIQIYFAPSPKICPALCKFIRSATRSVEVCAFDIKLDAVVDALIEAQRHNISVRVVTDTDYLKNDALGRLSQAGIPIVSDRKNSLMHNKFIVVDSRYLWTGSYNLTDNGTWKNDNNAIIIESPAVASGYRARFEEYWKERFSTDGRPSAMERNVFVGRIPAYFAFSPTDRIRDTILQELSTARKTVDVMAFSFTGAEIAAKLRDLCGKGVRVRCLFDTGQAKNKASRDEYLRKIGAQVFYSPNRSGKMHHKVFIIDGKTVITGSYNFSKNAESRNDENILLLRSEEIAKLYTAEMNRCIKGIKGY